MSWDITDPHAIDVAEVARALDTDPARGLSDQDARRRLALAGANALERRTRPAYAAIAARQLLDPLVALLVVAAIASLLTGERIEGIAIGSIVLLNGLLGFGQEVGSERAILALSETLRRRASVIRNGREREITAEEIVPGDVIVLREGERVAADGRLASAEGLAVDESTLTGESIPADKSTAAVTDRAPLAERTSLVFAGTAVTRGRGHALVTATGPRAEIGKVASLTERAKPPATPLQRRLRGLTEAMVVLGIVITVALAVVRLLQGASLQESFLLGVSVAVAAVPEGLAATVTIALALGARRMAARGAIVRRLPAVETLGSATVIASDKTGTLTQNRLRLKAVEPAAGYGVSDVLKASVLASTADLFDEDGQFRVVGDPVEGALLMGAREHGISPAELRAERSLLREVPFDPQRKRMTVVYEQDGAVRAFMKGAPEVLLARAAGPAGERRRLEAVTEEWARRGLRVLAVAERPLDRTVTEDEELERGVEVVGLVALHDPLRSTAAEAVRAAQGAGVRVQILTGDHPATAGAIARELRLPECAVSARVTPADKLRLVRDLQADGEVVAVTGDGVNDAPALRRSDVGVAMGSSGTEAAREASDMVLTDDNFSTMVAAIREGRAIADNVRKFVAFLLSANLGEVLLFAAAVLAGMGAPMTVVQVLTVNLITDGLPAVALALDPALPGVMARPPESGQRLFSRESWAALGLVGTLVGAAAVGAFVVGRAVDPEAAQTMAFATIALGELAIVFGVRSPLWPAWKHPRNLHLLGAVGGSTALLMLTLYLSPLHEPFGTVALDVPELALVVGFALFPFAMIEATKALLRRFAPAWAAAALRAPR